MEYTGGNRWVEGLVQDLKVFGCDANINDDGTITASVRGKVCDESCTTCHCTLYKTFSDREKFESFIVKFGLRQV